MQETWTDAEIEHAANCLAVATIKYGMLKIGPGSDITFDLDEWVAKKVSCMRSTVPGADQLCAG